MGRRVNTGCWLPPAPRFPPLPAAAGAASSPRGSSQAVALCHWQQGCHSGGWQRTPHTLVPGRSHLFTRPITSFDLAALSAPVLALGPPGLSLTGWHVVGPGAPGATVGSQPSKGLSLQPRATQQLPPSAWQLWPWLHCPVGQQVAEVRGASMKEAGRAWAWLFPEGGRQLPAVHGGFYYVFFYLFPGRG